jgi:GMP synthase (glutamine-hydrolysing)
MKITDRIHQAEEKEVLIIKNITREGPGILGDLIREKGIGSRIVDLSAGETIDDVERYGAVIVLGGPDSANDENVKMKNELELIRQVLALDIPYLGICLGLQTLVKAAGGQVIKSPVKETGFRERNGDHYSVRLTSEGRMDPMFDGLDNSFNVFHLHGETVMITDKMLLLAEGMECRNQIVKAGPKAYGIQCHFELTEEMFGTWINEDPDLLSLDREKLITDFLAMKEAYFSTGRRLFTNFLKIAGYTS